MSHAVLCGDMGRFFIGLSMRMRRSRYIFCAAAQTHADVCGGVWRLGMLHAVVRGVMHG